MSDQLTWEQKLAALTALCSETHVEMRHPGNWYVASRMEHAEGQSMLIGDYGNGATPELAVADHWNLYGNGVPLKTGEQWWRWNGYMWEQSERPQP